MAGEVSIGRGLPPLPASTRRRAVLESLTAAGEMQTNWTVNESGSLAERRFTELALESSYTEIAGDRWPCELETLGDVPNVVFRDCEEVVCILPGGTVVYTSLAYGWMRLHVAAPSRDDATGACSAFRQAYPASYLVDDGDPLTPITFWSLSRYGPEPRLRKINTSSWSEIEHNYPTAVHDELEELMSWQKPERNGQLFVWQGPPGTGKSWALRALASEWSSWAEFHYITDPDAFFVKDPSYMVNVLLADSYSAIDAVDGNVYEQEDPLGKWRVLILEDTGELLAANAKEEYGQGLSRLLNVVDGMIGQGLRVLALVTTNDELGDLAPAAVRPGRCASCSADGNPGPTVFGPMSAEEASVWLGEEVTEGGTLAELYSRRSEKAAGSAAFAAEETDVRAEIAKVATLHQPDDPGYGQCAWNAENKTVYWISWDGTSVEDHNAAEEAFLSIDGVDRVVIEAESIPSGWWSAEVVYPEDPPRWVVECPESASIEDLVELAARPL